MKIVKLRKLKLEDARFMLEWMHDSDITKNLQTNFAVKSILDCEDFIIESWNNMKNKHLAIVDNNDIYMGTTSLKNITDTNAEFAIVVRKKAMGKGYSGYGMKEIIRIGFEELGLENIYWYVASDNQRALRFYDKNGYHRILEQFFFNTSQVRAGAYIWYQETNTLRK